MGSGWRRLRAPLAATCVLASLALFAGPGAAAGADRPNIVFILLDDVGYGDLGAYGGSFVATPNLDRLAAEGMRFTQYRSSAPVCSPSRAAILTGQYPIRFGISHALDPDSWRGLPAGVPTFADHLHSAGYATGHFGKWHLGKNRPEYLPNAHGFQRSLVNVPGLEGGGYVDPWLSVDGGPPFRGSGHETEITTQHAIEFVVANRARRFFANVWYRAPHVPYTPPERWSERYPDTAEGRYAAMLSHVDEEIGRLLFMLRLLGLDSRTLVVVASDNGGTRKAIPSNGGLAGYKGSVFEGGLRVPLIARWRGEIAGGAVNESPVNGIDLAPTLLEVAGVAPPADLPGRRLGAALRGESVAATGTAVWEVPRIVPLVNPGAMGRYGYAVLRGSWKLVERQLFDLSIDPNETTDLAGLHPELATELEREYRGWRRRESRLAVPIAQVSGAATVRGDWLDLAGGEVRLEPDARLGFHDGAFTFSVRVLPGALGTEQVVAEHPGSWRLALGEAGTPRLSLVGEDGTPVEIEGPTAFAPGVAVDLAFRAVGWATTNAEVQLLVDSQPVAETQALRAVQASIAPIRIGSDASGTRPFRGWLWSPRLHLVSLDDAELADLDADGVPNAWDACIGVADAGRGDGDGDGIGDACDPDLNGNGIVGTADRLLLQRAFGQREGDPLFEPRLDFDGDGAVGLADLAALERAFGAPPGPSGLRCTRAEPCPAP
jgi:arylsulfatase A-like enzyme